MVPDSDFLAQVQGPGRVQHSFDVIRNISQLCGVCDLGYLPFFAKATWSKWNQHSGDRSCCSCHTTNAIPRRWRHLGKTRVRIGSNRQQQWLWVAFCSGEHHAHEATSTGSYSQQRQQACRQGSESYVALMTDIG